MGIITKERLISAKVPEKLIEDFRIECKKRRLPAKKAMAQAICDWMILKLDRRKSLYRKIY